MVKKIRRILLLACILLVGCGSNKQNQDVLVSVVERQQQTISEEEITEQTPSAEEAQSESPVLTFPDIAEDRIVNMEGIFIKR